MKIYFLSSIPCALTVNGAFFGTTDRFERFAEVSLKDNLFLTFTPENALPLSFFLTENIRFSPPEGVDVYLLPSAIALYARDFPPRDATLNVISQKRFDDALVTVFSQGRIQCTVQTQDNFFTAPLPPSFAHCELSRSKDFYLLRSPAQLAVFHKNGNRLLLETVLDYELNGDELTATLPLSDSRNRLALCKWHLSDTAATLETFTLRQTHDSAGERNEARIADELTAFAFFESVLLGAPYTPFLSDSLVENADQIKDFLGNFQAVTLTSLPNVCGLVYQKGERLFEVKYFTLQIENGKIVDVQG